MPEYPVDVFLPAAGLGERLRPVTNHLPKPLLPILGTPIIERILTKLTAVCDGRIGINLHWKADLLRAWAGASPWRDRVVFFPEALILGTGGALKNAASLLSRGPFIVHNSDILLDIDFDVASVLWDPYYRLDDGVRERLLAGYLDEMRMQDDKAFVESLLPCRLQRHMQALGAYGFLSEAKGKRYFLKHVPEALRLLKGKAAEARPEYPELARLIASL